MTTIRLNYERNAGRAERCSQFGLLPTPENAKVWGIDLRARRKEVRLARDTSGATLEASTVQKDGTYMAYEITME